MGCMFDMPSHSLSKSRILLHLIYFVPLTIQLSPIIDHIL